MARVHITIPDDDRDRFFSQARREGMTLSAWLRAAAHERLESRTQLRRLRTPDELETFFRACDADAGPGREPDWEEHLATMRESRLGRIVDA